MKKHEAEKLIAVIRELANWDGQIPSDEDLRRDIAKGHPQASAAASPGKERKLLSDASPEEVARVGDRINEAQVEKLYLQIKNRLLDDLRVDPVFVQLLANVSEIVVELTPRVITLEGDSLKGRLARLIAGGFFNEARKQGTARAELARTGPDCNSGNLSRAMTDFVADGFLTRDGESFIKAPGIKVTEKMIGLNV